MDNIADTFDPRLRQIMATVDIEYVGGNNAMAQGIDPTIGGSIEQKASNLMQVARTQSPEQAQATLRAVLDLGLETSGNEPARRILAATYEQLAGHYEGQPERQGYLLSQAASFTPDGEMREDLESQVAALGTRAEVVEIAQAQHTPDLGVRDFGPDDTCASAPAAGAPSVTTMSIANPSGGFQDTNFLEIVIPAGVGLALEIETTSPNCSDETSCSNVAYDTDVSLWQMCDGGFEDMLLERDPTGDSGLGWLSKIQTACLLPDSYFLEVNGQFGAAPKNFDVNVRVVGTCVVPVADSFEDDNTNSKASSIGHPSSIPDHATGWRGREKQEIQDHSIFPRNENDNMLIELTRTETMMMVAQKQVSSMVEGTPDVPSGPDADSELIMLYQNDPHGGVCNQVPLSLANYCKSSCASGGIPAVPSLPTSTCIPLSQVTFSGEAVPRFGAENPLLYNDDSNPAGGNLGSKLEICMPRTQPGGPSLANQGNGFVMRTRGWRPPFSGSVSTLSYDYQSKGQARGPCDSYEVEPNNAFADATPTPDEAVYVLSGVWEGSETYPAADVDVWGPFDVANLEEYTIEVFPQIINAFGDSELQLWAGPSDSGDFVLVASDNDAGKPNSRINLLVLPADEFLGNTMADANYYITVSTDVTQPVPNWWYNMRVLTPRVDAVDIEDNDFDPQVVEYRGNTIIQGAIAASCDIDRYEYTLNESQFMTYATTGFTDTVLNLEQVTGVFDLNIHGPNVSAGEFAANLGPHAFGIAGTRDNFQGVVVVAQDGVGATNDCCTAITNNVAGVIAMCDRGTCGFAVKAKMVQDAGASGYLLANNSAAAPPGMGGTDATVVIPCVSTLQTAGNAMKAAGAGTIRISLDDRKLMACDDDGNPLPGNPYASIISGCLPPGDYVLSVRGWSNSSGPYVFTMRGVAGCTPTVPPTLVAPVPGSFCSPNSFERNCVYP